MSFRLKCVKDKISSAREEVVFAGEGALLCAEKGLLLGVTGFLDAVGTPDRGKILSGSSREQGGGGSRASTGARAGPSALWVPGDHGPKPGFCPTAWGDASPHQGRWPVKDEDRSPEPAGRGRGQMNPSVPAEMPCSLPWCRRETI